MTGKRILATLAALLGPAVVIGLAYWTLDDLGWPVVALLYGGTLAWVIAFFHLRPCRISVLPLSFLATAIGPYLYDSAHPGWFQYLGVTVVAFFYSLPWAAATLIVCVVILVRQRRRKGAVEDGLPQDEA